MGQGEEHKMAKQVKSVCAYMCAECFKSVCTCTCAWEQCGQISVLYSSCWREKGGLHVSACVPTQEIKSSHSQPAHVIVSVRHQKDAVWRFC
jgi:hypothetical protein